MAGHSPPHRPAFPGSFHYPPGDSGSRPSQSDAEQAARDLGASRAESIGTDHPKGADGPTPTVITRPRPVAEELPPTGGGETGSEEHGRRVDRPHVGTDDAANVPQRRRLWRRRRLKPAPARKAGDAAWFNRYRRLWPAAIAAGFMVIVAMLPWLVAHSPLMTAIIQRAAADLEGTVRAKSASLGWFSPIVLYGVEVHDRQGNLVLEVPRLAGDKAMLALLFDSTHLGRFDLDEPKLHVVLRERGSNLEDLLARYLDPQQQASQREAAIAARDGSVTVVDQRGRRTWQIDSVQMEVSVPADRAKPVTLRISGSVPGQLQAAPLEVSLEVHRSFNSEEQAAGQAIDSLSVKTEGGPLGLAEPLLRRWVTGLELSGRCTGAFSCQWDHTAPADRMLIEGKLRAEEVRLAMPALGADRPTLAWLDASGRLLWQDGRLECQRMLLECEAGQLAMTGAVDWAGQAARAPGSTLLHQVCEIRGQVDLARLAAMLPSTLRIQKGTQITSGQLQVQYSGRRQRQGNFEGMAWQARLEASNLTGLREGRRIAWQQPILLNIAAHEGPQGPVIETLQCDSNFLRLRAAGTRDLLTATATFDLSRLADQSAGFVDLGGLKLAGEGTAQLTWERYQEDYFETMGELRIVNFRLALPGQPVWTEPAVTAGFTATGRADFRNYNRIDTATARIEAGADQLHARLMQPVTSFWADWPLELHAQGQLARWETRLAPWLDLAGWRLQGVFEFLSAVRWGQHTLVLEQTRLGGTNLAILGPWLNIQEPKAELTLAMRWDRTGQRLDLHEATLTTSALALQTKSFVLALPQRGPVRISGTLQANAALDRLQAWLTPAGVQPPWRLAGQLGARAEIQQIGGMITARFDVSAVDFTAANPAGQRFQEKEIRLAGRGSYNDVSRSFQLDQVELASSTVGIAASGKLSRPDGQLDLQLAGTAKYDFERISQLIRSRFGEGVQINGRGTSPFAYRGPLGTEGATASLGFAWHWADVYGFQVGPGDLEATFARGILEIKPLVLAVNQGQVQLAPRVHLVPGPVELTLQPGRLAHQVRINPIMCAHGLEYIAPVLAGIASAEGVFSIELDNCRIPIDAPGRGDLSGRLIIHDVRVGPGYLIQELAQLAGRANQVQITRQSVVPFRMVDGRIYHRDLELAFPEVTIRTYGSVGVEDQSLAMMAEMPIPARWQTNPAVAAALRNQVIQIPISGTLRQPRIDRRAFDQLARQFMQNAAQNMLETQLNKQLDRILQPPKK